MAKAKKSGEGAQTKKAGAKKAATKKVARKTAAGGKKAQAPEAKANGKGEEVKVPPSPTPGFDVVGKIRPDFHYFGKAGGRVVVWGGLCYGPFMFVMEKSRSFICVSNDSGCP